MKTIIVLVCTLLLTSLTSAQTHIYYVSPGASGANSGANWTDAFASLERALDPIWNPDIGTGVDVELRLRNTTYIPDGSLRFPPLSPDVRHSCFVIPDQVQIRGGWDGSET